MDAQQDSPAVDTTPERPRLKQWAPAIAQGVVAITLLASGVGFTVYQAHPEWRQVGEVVATAAVIEAPAPNDETLRIASVLRPYARDPENVDRIAGAIVNEGRRRNLDPALLVGVLLTEDATLDTMARSQVGARGLMQVMPFHSGKWGCNSPNLFGIESNICHGASVLEDAVKSAPNMRVALLRYNGCVRGSNTPNCHTYPDKVIRVANRATAQMLTSSVQ